MFSKPKNISVKIPDKQCNAHGTTIQFPNPNHFASVHNQVLLIHPEWLNGFNAAFKKSFEIDKNIYRDFGVNSTGLSSIQFGCDYFANNLINLIQKWPIIGFGLNYQPMSSFRLKFKNYISIPTIFDGPSGDDRKRPSILLSGALHADWFGKSSNVSCSVITSNQQSIAANLSFLTNATSNFAWGAELHYKQGNKQTPNSLEPCLTAAYLNPNINLAASYWPNLSKIDFSCFKQIGKHFQSGSIFVIDIPAQMTTGTVFCQYQWNDSVIRAKIASNGLIGATYAIKIWNFNIRTSILGNISTKKIIYGMKIGLEI